MQLTTIGSTKAVTVAMVPASITTTKNQKDSSFQKAFIRGGMARCIGQATLYPLDALRTLAQTRDAKLADVGAKALIRGCLTTSSFALVMGALQFSVFGQLREKQNVKPPFAAACAATASCIVSVPQEVIKQRLVTGVYPSFRKAVKSIWKQEGIRGFYHSWKPTMLRNIPFVVITFTAQDIIKNRILSSRNHSSQTQKNLSLGENLATGMMSALIAGIITNPVDVIKTRMMTQASSNALPYKSALDCAITVMQKEGIGTFYAGFQQRSIYMCGLWGITFAINGRLNSVKSGDEK